MAGGVNKVILIGNLGQEPEVKHTKNGTAVCNLRLAVGERRKVGGEWQDHTEWMTVIAFNKTAENIAAHLSKGSRMFVEGKLQTRQYENKDGQPVKTTEILANNVVFLGGGAGGGQKKSQKSIDEDDGFYDDQLPF